MKKCVLLLAMLVFAGCAPRVQTTQALVGPEDEARAANLEALEVLASRSDGAIATSELPILPVTVVSPPATAAELGEGEIDREAFNEFLEDGPPQVFQALRLAPVLSDNAFSGFRIESIAAASGPFSACGLRAGDIVTSINGRDISRVEGFLQVWESMRLANHLHVDIIRAGEAQTLVWRIQ